MSTLHKFAELTPFVENGFALYRCKHCHLCYCVNILDDADRAPDGWPCNQPMLMQQVDGGFVTGLWFGKWYDVRYPDGHTERRYNED